jgi:DNA-binding LacI/PurR family transcriptional regulator
MDTPKLLGHSIIRASKINLADQIHYILCKEIHAGRWEIGEKLPSMMTLANQCQVSRMPVQQAIERLGAEGYVRQENRSGIFLASTAPKGQSLGVIGLVLHSNPKNDRELEHLGFEQLLVHRFMKFAAARNYQTRVYYADDQQDWSLVNQIGAVFDESVKGIVSLVPFLREDISALGDNRIPLVFWCEPDHRCFPCVASDYEMAFYCLTHKLIQQGHRSIVPVAWVNYTVDLNRSYFRGYRRAMLESGLKVREDIYEQTLSIGSRDSLAAHALIQSLPDVSAYACVCAQRADQVVQALTIEQIAVPQSVSVACGSPERSPLGNGLIMSGMGYDSDKEMRMCFELIREQSMRSQWDVGTVLLAPYWIEGGTVAAGPHFT